MKLANKIRNKAYFTDNIFFTFAQQLYKLYKLQQIAEKVFGDLLNKDLEQIKEEFNQVAGI